MYNFYYTKCIICTRRYNLNLEINSNKNCQKHFIDSLTSAKIKLGNQRCTQFVHNKCLMILPILEPCTNLSDGIILSFIGLYVVHTIHAVT